MRLVIFAPAYPSESFNTSATWDSWAASAGGVTSARHRSSRAPRGEPSGVLRHALRGPELEETALESRPRVNHASQQPIALAAGVVPILREIRQEKVGHKRADVETHGSWANS